MALNQRAETADPIDLAFSQFHGYIRIMFEGYDIALHHLQISKALMDVEAGKIRRLMIFMPPRHGKLLSDFTELPTLSGWKKHGDLKIGDYVYGLDGNPTMVTHIAPKYLATLEVEFTNGQKIKCHENHEWTVWDRSKGKWCTYETKHFIKKTKFGKRIKLFSGNRFTFQLPLIQPIQFQEQKLPMHPYALGAWLGDGQSREPRICASYEDEVVLRAVSACGYINGYRTIHNTTGVIYQYYKDGMLDELRNLNILKNKHIPDIYKFSSIEQRLELLAGLIDTDGSVESETGRVRIATADPILACDIKELIRSFGWHVCHYKQEPCTSSSGITGTKEVSYLGFQPTLKIPTRITRKEIIRLAPQRRISIKAVTECDPEPGNSISVDSPDGLYLVGKTLIPTHNTMQVSEFFPAWYLGRNPNHQIIAATYSYERAGDVGRAVRNQFLHPLYNEIFPTSVLSPDSRGANKLSTTNGGNYYSVGVGGAIVGRGANLFLIDDPLKSREDAESKITRKKLQDWFKSVAYTRLMPDNRIVIVMTRWHYEDLAGYLLEKKTDNWHVLSLPAIAEENCTLTKRQIGEALWRRFYPLSKLKQIRDNIGSREWSAQYQQRPLDEEGSTFKLSQFKRYDYRPVVEYDIMAVAQHDPPDVKPFGIMQIVISWDTAFKESEVNDPSSATVWGISKNGYYLIHVFNKHLSFPKLKHWTKSLWKRYSKWNVGPVMVIIEDRGSGQSLIQVIKDETRIPIVGVYPEKNKVLRAEEVSTLIEGGRVYLPDEAPWLVKYETNMCQFPLGREDDDVDSTTQFLKWVSKPRYKRRNIRWYK